MLQLSFGCQTYPWKMGKKYFGEVPHMLEVASKAGFQSLEAEIDMLGDYFGDNLTAWIKEFQRLNDLTADGGIGKITLAKLREYGMDA